MKEPKHYNQISDIRRALTQYFQLCDGSTTENPEAIAMISDLKECLGLYGRSIVLTEKQRVCILGCLIEGKTEATLAADLGISQQSVNSNIRYGVKRISDYLYSGKVTKPVFSEGEDLLVIQFYKEGKVPKDIAILLDKRVQTIRNKIKQLRKKNLID